MKRSFLLLIFCWRERKHALEAIVESMHRELAPAETLPGKGWLTYFARMDIQKHPLTRVGS